MLQQTNEQYEENIQEEGPSLITEKTTLVVAEALI